MTTARAGQSLDLAELRFVELRKARFRYPPAEHFMPDQISFMINHGENVAITESERDWMSPPLLQHGNWPKTEGTAQCATLISCSISFDGDRRCGIQAFDSPCVPAHQSSRQRES